MKRIEADPGLDAGNEVTKHGLVRMQQRAISREALDLTLRRGTRIEQNGATVYFLGRRHLPPDLTPAEASRLERTGVVVGRDGAVITTFRRHRVPRKLRRRRPRLRRRWS